MGAAFQPRLSTGNTIYRGWKAAPTTKHSVSRVTRNANSQPATRTRTPQRVTRNPQRVTRNPQRVTRTPQRVTRNPSESFHLPGEIVFQGAFAINIRGGTMQSASERGYLE